jgi:hypothetical protein
MHAFPVVVTRELEYAEISCQSELVPYVALHHPEKVIEACSRFHPDVLVLQLGNYELGNELGRYLAARVGLNSRKRSSSPMPSRAVVNQSRYSLRAHAKQWIDRCLGHPLIDFVEMEAKYRTFLAATAQSAGQVIVTSPTPCADPTADYYRRRALPVIEVLAGRHHCTFVNLMVVAAAAVERTLGRDLFFADAVHLGIAGQEAVGLRLAVEIRKVVKNVVEDAPIKL